MAYVQLTQNDVSQQYALDFVNGAQHDAPATVIPLPKYPDPSPNYYVVGILKFCHKNVSSCFGCGGNFKTNGYQRPENSKVVTISSVVKYLLPFYLGSTIFSSMFICSSRLATVLDIELRK